MNQTEYEAWINGIKKNFPYYNPAPKDANNQEQFPIVASGTSYKADILTIPEDILQQIRECGFTVCSKQTIQYSNYHVYYSLQNAKKKGINLMFNCWGFYPDEETHAYGIEYSINNKPKEESENCTSAFGGVSFFDEPTYIQMTETDRERRPNGDYLLTDYKALMEQEAPTIVFINLVGGCEPKYMNGIPGYPGSNDNLSETEKDKFYSKYLETFQKQFKPSLYCFDLYPIDEQSPLLYSGLLGDDLIKKLKEGYVNVERDSFLNRLEQFSTISKEHSVPFWTYLQGRSFYTIKRAYFAPPALEQYLRFEAFSALAYGAKGLALWSYPLTENNETEGYMSALINRRNEKTAAWYFAKNINEDIQKYRSIFLYSAAPKTSRTPIFKFQDSGNTILTIKSDSDKEILVGEFQVVRNKYFLVVNIEALDYLNITVNVHGAKITELTPITSHGDENVQLNEGDNPRILPPGGFRIFQYFMSLPIG